MNPTKIYTIEVDCPGCAMKMENAVKSIDGILQAKVSLMAQKMSVTFREGVDCDALMKQARALCRKIDRDLDIIL